MSLNLKKYSELLFQDGFVHIRSLLERGELNDLIKAIESNQASPSPFAKNMKSQDNSGDFFMDFNNWRRLHLIKNICYMPKIVDLVLGLTNSKNCWLFHDHVLVKNGKSIATPWHQDRPYYIFKGDLNLSVWITADKVPSHSGLAFVRGSHKSSKMFMPKAFATGENIASDEGFEVLKEDAIDKREVIDFDMEPGDAIVFFNTTIHSGYAHKESFRRRSMSIRYLLDGASLTKKYINATPPFDRMGLKIQENGDIPEMFPKLRG